MLGYEVNKSIIDAKSAEAVLSIRSAFDQVETFSKWLANNPNPGPDSTTDPLVVTYEYTADEAYALRLYFETLENLRTTNSSTFDVGRKMTGLE